MGAMHGRTAYAASKHATNGFYDALRAEVEDAGIAVTLVAPGILKTDFTRNMSSGSGRSSHTACDPQGGMSAEECARRILAATARRRRELVIAPWKPKLWRMMRAFCPCMLFDYMLHRARQDQNLRRQASA